MVLLFSLLSLIAVLASLTVAGLVLFRNSRPPMNKVFVILCLSVAFWAFAEFETRHAPDAQTAAEFIRLQLIWPLAPAFLLHFTLLFTKHRRLLRHALTYFLMYVPSFAIVLGYLLIPGNSGEPIHKYWGWTYTIPSAPYYTIEVIYVALLALTALFLCFQYFRRQTIPEERARAGLIMIGIGVPVIAGSVSQVLIPLLGASVPELTTISFAVGAGGFIGYAILRYNLFELTPSTAADKIIETMSDSLVIVDPGGRITTTNGAALRLLGYRRDELVGNEFGILFDNEDDLAECSALLEDETVTGASSIEVSFRTSTGKVVPISLSCSTLKDSTGHRLGTVCVARDISERKRREAATRESELRYRTLIDTSPDGVILLDMQGTILMCNRQIYAVHGFHDPAELIGRNAAEFMLPEDRQRMADDLRNISEKPDRPMVEYALLYADGESTWPAWIKGSLLRNAEGRPEGFLLILRDLTQLKQAEEALRDSEQRYRTLFDTSPDGILVLDLDGTVRMCNPPIYEAHGFHSAEQILGRNGTDFVTPDEKQKAAEHLQSVARGESVIVQYDLLTADSGTWPAAINGAAIRDEDGNPAGILLIVRDITEQIEADKALRESETRYRTLFETSPDGVMLLDLAGNTIMANSRAAHIIGYENPDDLTGINQTKFVVVSDRERLARDFREALSTVVRNREYRFIREDGTRCYVDLSASALVDARGEPFGILSVIEDITERKRAERALIDKEAMLTEAQRVAHLGSWDLDNSTGELHWTEEVFRIFGMTPREEINQEVFFQHVHPDDVEAVRRAFGEALARGEIPAHAHRILREDGAERYVHEEGTVILGAEGKPAHVVGTIQDITEQKLAEMALQESEARYRELIDTSPDDIALIDLKGNYIMANRRAAELHGYDSVEELMQVNYLDLIVPEEREAAQTTLAGIVRDGVLRAVDFTLLRKDGSRFPAEINATVIKDSEGRPHSILGIIRDISERKIVEEEIQRMADDISLINLLNDASNRGDSVMDILNLMAQEVRTMFDCTGAGVYTVSDDGEYLHLNNFMIPPAKLNLIERLVGSVLKNTEIKARLTPDSLYARILRQKQVELFNNPEALRQMMLEFAHSPALKTIVPNILRISGIKSVMSVPLVTGGGPLGLLDFSRAGSFSEDDADRIRSIAEHLGVILERKRSEEALARSEASYRTLVETSPDAIEVTDLDGRITLCNQQSARLLGYPSVEDVTGRMNLEFIAPEDRETAGARWAALNQPGAQLSDELTFVRSDGTRFHAEVTATTIEGDAGKPLSIIGIMRDITERKRYEEQIISQSRELAERNRELDALYGVSAAVGHTIDMDELLERALEKIVDLDLFRIRRGAGIMLVEDDHLVLAAHLGHQPEFIEKHRDLKIGECLCGRAAQTGEVVVSGDCFQDERHTIRYPGMQDHGDVIVPLKGLKKVVGVMYMYTLPNMEIDDRKLALLATIGNQIGIAIQNARLYEETRQLSLHDPLTGLANRNLMNLELDQGFARAKRTGVPVSLIMLDLDFFKKYNDRYGHAAGDRALQEIAQILTEEVREVDLPARFGGEEFLIVLTETNLDDAVVAAGRIRAVVERHDFFPQEGGPPARMTVSLGVAASGKGFDSGDKLISAVDTALYQAKTKGRNRVETWQGP